MELPFHLKKSCTYCSHSNFLRIYGLQTEWLTNNDKAVLALKIEYQMDASTSSDLAVE